MSNTAAEAALARLGDGVAGLRVLVNGLGISGPPVARLLVRDLQPVRCALDRAFRWLPLSLGHTLLSGKRSFPFAATEATRAIV